MNNIDLVQIQEIARIAEQQRKLYNDLAKSINLSATVKNLTIFNDAMRGWQSDMIRFHEGITRAIEIRPAVFDAINKFEEIQKRVSCFNEEHQRALRQWKHLADSVNAKNIFSAYLNVGSEFKRVFVPIKRLDSFFKRTIFNFSNIGVVQSRFTQLYITEFDPEMKDVFTPEIDLEPIDKLDKLLFDIHPSLVDRRKGAWQAFKSDNPDKQSQAANSMVELLDHAIGQVLGKRQLKDYLLEKHFPEEVRSYQEKQYEWVRKTGAWISSTKDNLHSIKHGIHKRPEEFVETLLIASERILLIVLGPEESD